jgi:cell division protein FtsI/penicillin-binding protein 2
MMRNETRGFSSDQFRLRLRFVLAALVLIAIALVARAVDLQVLDDGFLEGQGDARYTRIAKLSATRGTIYDRNGESLAASMPVDTVWASPPEVMREVKKSPEQIPRLAEALNMDQKLLTQRITSNLDREFIYLVRHMAPNDAAQVASLKIPGVYLLREYARFYPAGEVTGHVLGFTRRYSDIGQEGLELSYDHRLGAQPGAKRVIQDRLGRTIEDVESIRAATDIFEPGSSIKPFIAAAAVATGRFHATTTIDTSPGFVQVGAKRIEDKHNLGAIPLTTVLAESSNVGMTRMALQLKPEAMWEMLTAFGFGQGTGSGLPAEPVGLLHNYRHWGRIHQATISYGYGLSVTALQLAHAYATLGAGGIDRPVRLERVQQPVPGERVLDERIAKELLQMMESVVTQDGGTGKRAALYGYRVAGKTGTARKAENGGYSTERYLATFGGVVPASKPRLAAIVVIDEPQGGKYYGGEVAAPVFANVMAGALRLMGVPPDGLDRVPVTRVVQASREP